MIRLNESQLKRIITESVKKVINEIGDTPEGRKAIKSLINKGMEQGRSSQANNVNKGLLKIYDKEFAPFDSDSLTGVTSNMFTFSNINGTEVKVLDNGEIFYRGNTFSFPCDYATTRDQKLARKIAQWCQENVEINEIDKTKDPDTFEKMCDWHNWIY